jgi:hypothetical protein
MSAAFEVALTKKADEADKLISELTQRIESLECKDSGEWCLL